MRRVLNTDYTDYTDNLFGDADSSLSSVVRSVFEHGLHGLHGFFFWRTWIFLGVPWCVRVLNTDCTDYTDFFWRRDYSVEFL